mgnify:CR=1 FL=1
MRYFILLPEDSEEDVDYSTNILGEVSFKNFWTEEGFGILERLVEKYPDTLTEVKIKDEQNKNYTVEEFLEKIGKKILMRETFSNHRGSLVEGERVTLISLNEQKGVAEVNDPFDITWTIPINFLLDTY